MVVLLTYGLCNRKKTVSHLTSAARLACSCMSVGLLSVVWYSTTALYQLSLELSTKPAMYLLLLLLVPMWLSGDKTKQSVYITKYILWMNQGARYKTIAISKRIR